MDDNDFLAFAVWDKTQSTQIWPSGYPADHTADILKDALAGSPYKVVADDGIVLLEMTEDEATQLLEADGLVRLPSGYYLEIPTA